MSTERTYSAGIAAALLLLAAEAAAGGVRMSVVFGVGRPVIAAAPCGGFAVPIVDPSAVPVIVRPAPVAYYGAPMVAPCAPIAVWPAPPVVVCVPPPVIVTPPPVAACAPPPVIVAPPRGVRQARPCRR